MPLNPIDRTRAENPKDKAISTNPPQPTVKTEGVYRGATLSGVSLEDPSVSSKTSGALSQGKNSDLYAQMKQSMSGFFQTHSIVMDDEGVSRVKVSQVNRTESTQVRIQEQVSKASEDMCEDLGQLHIDEVLEGDKSGIPSPEVLLRFVSNALDLVPMPMDQKTEVFLKQYNLGDILLEFYPISEKADQLLRISEKTIEQRDVHKKLQAISDKPRIIAFILYSVQIQLSAKDYSTDLTNILNKAS